MKPEDIEMLFGKDFEVEKIFQEIDTETNGEVHILRSLSSYRYSSSINRLLTMVLFNRQGYQNKC